MFKLFALFFVTIIALAAAKPGILSAPLAYTASPYTAAAYAAPYSAAYASPYYASYASPYVAASPYAAAYSAYPYSASYLLR